MRQLTFQKIVWIFCGLAVVFFVCGPPFHTFIASFFWKSQACIINGNRYAYVIDGVQYIAQRHNFWEPFQGTGVNRVAVTFAGRSGSCFVDPSDPASSVLYLDYRPKPEQIVKPLVFSFGVILVCSLLTQAIKRKRLRSLANPIR